ncbi:hypothetical protein SPRG_18214 [Saprolegnia parasitica CBS 223.65]|uniref:Uncharacterized protein n=1 Tax=Saprolegnia parasitica (strain CBS 223.65) TaxID=695850 RepID=A0A067BPK4_SAPPC|nr:hypothetical protein SPRG_18214 [Saprolegnia parasitica CBS 223.65]KDO16251.1 hypothetical protein SPRG_18214 [Saprolegnia parasitica CBS 223.65]|eukprot:XP_012213041.1 hypothetical protein SPRG_18214 [Saprolegnia parasitica CBS 223.65]
MQRAIDRHTTSSDETSARMLAMQRNIFQTFQIKDLQVSAPGCVVEPTVKIATFDATVVCTASGLMLTIEVIAETFSPFPSSKLLMLYRSLELRELSWVTRRITHYD